MADNLFLAVVARIGQDLQASSQTWQQMNIAVTQISAVLYHLVADESVFKNGNGIHPYRFVPLKGQRADDLLELSGPETVESDENVVNWAIISDTSDLLTRMENFCQLN